MKFDYTRSDVLAIVASACLAITLFYAATRSHGSVILAWLFGCSTIVLVAAPYLRVWRERWIGNAHSNESVEFDDLVIRRIMRSGDIESIRWTELAEVAIYTSDEGPESEDLYWALCNHDRSNGCAIPNCADGFKDLLSRLQALPGFDNQMVIDAMGSTSSDYFLVWRRDAESALTTDGAT